jgi:glutamate carboxypeptidase
VSDRELAAALYGWARDNRSRVLRDLTDLVELDAPSGDVALLDASAAVLERRVREIGGRVTRHPTRAGTHLEVRFGPELGRPLLILAHYDTVWGRGTAAERPLSIRDGIARGPGLFDMRGGLVAALNGIAALADVGALTRPLALLLTADEEAGSGSSEELIVRLGDESRVSIVPEPPLGDGGLKTGRKGVLTYRVSVHGRASHAGLDPERGVSAIHELLLVCQALRELADGSRGTTVNVGVIAGGSRSNVVAAEASAEIDVRVATMDEYARVETGVTLVGATTPAAVVGVERLHARPPLERTRAVAAAAERAKAIAALLGLQLSEGSVGGGSDGNFLACRGVAVVDGLGPVGGGAHAIDEHIVVDSLIERVALLGLLARLL